jgi:hypothetical protein
LRCRFLSPASTRARPPPPGAATPPTRPVHRRRPRWRVRSPARCVGATAPWGGDLRPSRYPSDCTQLDGRDRIEASGLAHSPVDARPGMEAVSPRWDAHRERRVRPGAPHKVTILIQDGGVTDRVAARWGRTRTTRASPSLNGRAIAAPTPVCIAGIAGSTQPASRSPIRASFVIAGRILSCATRLKAHLPVFLTQPVPVPGPRPLVVQ